MPSIASGSATPSSNAKIASLIIGHKILFEIKPGESLHDNAVLPIFSAALTTAVFTSFEVSLPLIISTNFIIGTGFIKCIPITFSGLFVEEAMESILMLEVFVARIVSGLHKLSNSWNNAVL